MVVGLEGGKERGRTSEGFLFDRRHTQRALVPQATEPYQPRLASRHTPRHMKAHVDQLASKEYWAAPAGGPPELVVMFVPGEAFSHRRSLDY